jgi:hypothetical protein
MVAGSNSVLPKSHSFCQPFEHFEASNPRTCKMDALAPSKSLEESGTLLTERAQAAMTKAPAHKIELMISRSLTQIATGWSIGSWP